MKIGLRTVKTVISATLAIIIAEQLGLLYPTAAGIIAVLSVTNTKKNSLFTGLYRVFSLALATFIAYVCFHWLSFSAIAFGVYLLLFIPAAAALNLSEGIVVSSVLVTHYLVEQNLSWKIIENEFLLMMIGVGLALLANMYMPDTEKKLRQYQSEIETTFRTLLMEMAHFLNQNLKENRLFNQCTQLKELLQAGEDWAKKHIENRLWSTNTYYIEYFSMRKMQRTILTEMLGLLEEITVDPQHVAAIEQLLTYTAENFAEQNDGEENMRRVMAVYEEYRAKPLPATREEFENRAQLFQFLQLFKAFIEVKSDFAKFQIKKSVE